MGTDYEVKILAQGTTNEGREAQGPEGDRGSGGSAERTSGPTNRNRIRGGTSRGERAPQREAPSWSKGCRVHPAAMLGRSVFLPGEISLRT